MQKKKSRTSLVNGLQVSMKIQRNTLHVYFQVWLHFILQESHSSFVKEISFERNKGFHCHCQIVLKEPHCSEQWCSSTTLRSSLIGSTMDAKSGDLHHSTWYLTITPQGLRNLSISGRNERPNWPIGSFKPILPLKSCNWPKAFFFSLFMQQFLRRASRRKTSLLSGRDSFRFCISTDRTFFLPMCFASRIFSILNGNYLTFL